MTAHYVAFFYFVQSIFILRFLKHCPLEEQVFNIFTFKMFPIHLWKFFIWHICLCSKQKNKWPDNFHKPDQPLWLSGAVLTPNCRLIQVQLINLIQVDAVPAAAPRLLIDLLLLLRYRWVETPAFTSHHLSEWLHGKEMSILAPPHILPLRHSSSGILPSMKLHLTSCALLRNSLNSWH